MIPAALPVWRCGDDSLPATSVARYVPPFLSAAYASEMGIRELYPWQAECLACANGRALHDQGNLVYSAPTSGGKTLVAELLLFRYQLQHNLFRSHGPLAQSTRPLPVAFRSLFVVPFNALVQEKARDLLNIVRVMYRNIQELERAATRGQGHPSAGCILPDPSAPQLHVRALDHVGDFARDSHVLVGVVTIEKAAMILNTLIAEKRMDELGLVVIDVSAAATTSTTHVPICTRHL